MISKLSASRRLSIAGLLLAAVAGARADQLRNVRRGQALPSFDNPGLDGKPVQSADLTGKVLVLVYLSARQRQSEEALASARRVTGNIGSAELKLVYMSADVEQADYFRRLRDRLMAHEPFALDEGRKYYGRLGLIVFPTTVITSKDGKLLHVLAGWTRNYEHQLGLRCRHALGEFDEAELARRLTARPPARDDARARADRRRSVGAVLRAKGMLDGAIREYEQALAIDPSNVIAELDLADILVARGRIDEAEQRIKDLLGRRPTYPAAKLMLGLIKLKRGRLDDAEKLLTEALLMNPDPVRTHYYLGELYERKGDYRLAMEHYRDALRRSLGERWPGLLSAESGQNCSIESGESIEEDAPRRATGDAPK